MAVILAVLDITYSKALTERRPRPAAQARARLADCSGLKPASAIAAATAGLAPEPGVPAVT